MSQRKALLPLAGALLALALAPGCPGDPQAVPVTDSGTTETLSVDAPVDADPQPAWDPVWHETKAKVWPTLGRDGLPACGPGCRIAINDESRHGRYYGHGYTTAALVDSSPKGVLRAAPFSDVTEVIAAPVDGDFPKLAHAFGDFVSYSRGKSGSGTVELMNAVTGEVKVAYRYSKVNGEYADVYLTALNSKYLFWMRDHFGLMSRNLQTGEIRTLVPGSVDCNPVCGVEGGLICSDANRGKITFIDHDTGVATVLDDGGALQLEGQCSPDRRQVVWIDFRDPPGRTSTVSYRSGGEVYVRDLVEKKTRRLTFDSPSKPTAKVFPIIEGDLVTWAEEGDGLDPNPELAQDIYAGARATAKLDLKAGERCRTAKAGIGGFGSMHKRHLFGARSFASVEKTFIIDIELDSPDLDWKCVPYP